MEILPEEVPIYITTKGVIGKPIVGVEERLLLVSELMEVPGGKLLKMKLRKGLLTKTKQTWTN